MKTKEITFSTIQKIKHNNNLLEKLSTIEKILDDLHFNYDISEFYEDPKDDCLNYFAEFWHRIELHQRALMKESQELIKSN